MNIYIHIYTYLYSNIYFIPRNKIKSNHRPCFLFSKTRERFRSRAHRNNRNSRWVSRALVNRHEINSRKERCALMIRGLGRKNRKTRGGEREGRGGERGEGGGGCASREGGWSIRDIPAAGHKECSAFDGLRHRASPAATLACRALVRAPTRLSTPLCANCVHAWSLAVFSFANSDHRDRAKFFPSSTINNPICAPDFRWKVGNFWRKIFFNFSRETNVCRIIIVNYYY